MNEEQLTAQIKAHARQQGARLVGIANVARLEDAPKGHRPEDFLPNAQSVIALGLPILRSFTRFPDFLKDSEMVPETLTRKSIAPGALRKGYRETHEVFQPRNAIANHMYRRCQYEALNMELQRISIYVAIHLEELGHDAICMPTTYGSTFSWYMTYPVPNDMGPFSHRHAAVAAGLGTFGMNNLVLTPEYGPLQRLVTVITTAQLQPDPLLKQSLCPGEKCSVCKKTCPHGAFADEIVEYTFGGSRARMWKMESGDHGKCNGPDGKPCGRECWLKCPLTLSPPGRE